MSDEQEARESIWSIHRDDLTWYAALFPLGWLLGMAYYVLPVAFSCDAFCGWNVVLPKMPGILVEKSGIVGLSSAVVSLMVLAGRGGIVMPLWNGWRKRQEKLREEGRREGQREGAKQLQDAIDKWEAKQANGGTDEPRPTAETIDYK